MSQTHLSLHIHLIFHTRDNRASIREGWRTNLHAYLGGCLKTAGCIPEAVGGTHDHVHILEGLSSTHRLADVVKDIKVASSKWVHQERFMRSTTWAAVVIVVAMFVCSCSSRVVYEPRSITTASPNAININNASADELEKLPHIGRKTAEAIVDHRVKHGAFRRVEHLMLIRGMSESRFIEIRDLIRIE